MADYTINPDNIPDPQDTTTDQPPITEAERWDMLARGPGQYFRTLGGYGARFAVNLPAFPASMYSTASDVLKAASQFTVRNGGDTENVARAKAALGTLPIVGPILTTMGATGFDGLPDADAARKMTDEFSQKADEVGSYVAGQDLKPGILSDNSPADKIGTVLSIGASMIPVTGGPIKQGFDGLKAVNSGHKVIDGTMKAAAETLPWLSPIIPVEKAAPLIGFNLGIGGSIQVATDLMEQRRKEVDTAVKQADAEIARGLEQQVAGIDEIFKANQELKQATAVANVQQGTVPSGTDPVTHVQQASMMSLDDWRTYAAFAGALALGAGIKSARNGVIRENWAKMFVGPELSKEGAKDFISKQDATQLGLAGMAKAQVLDSTVPLQAGAKSVGADPIKYRAQAEEIASAPELHLQSLLNDGRFGNGSTVTNVPMRQYVSGLEGLAGDTAKLETLRKGLVAESEVLNRGRLYNEVNKLPQQASNDPRTLSALLREVNAGGQAAEQKYAFHTFDPNTNTVSPTRNLMAEVAAMNADPEVKAVADAYKQITAKALEYRLEQNAMTRADFNNMKLRNPSYIPVRMEQSHFAPSNITPLGGRLEIGDPIAELLPYLRQTVTDTAHSTLVSSFIQEMKAKGASFLGREMDPSKVAPANSDKMIQFMTPQGVLRAIEVTDPMIRASLSKEAPTAMVRLAQAASPFFTAPARAIEQLNTGPATALVGSPFAFTNLAYGTGAAMLNRPAGTVAGVLDEAVQKLGLFKDAKGNAMGFRGDPTFMAQAVVQAAANVEAVLAKNLGKAIESAAASNIFGTNSAMTNTMAKVGKAVSDHYRASIVHEMETRALHGGATPMFNREVTRHKSIEDLFNAHQTLLGMNVSNNVKASWNNTRDFVHDIMSAIGSGANAAYYKQNRNAGKLTQQMLDTHTRNLTGDARKGGLATTATGKGLMSTIVHLPWGSVSVQAMSRFAEAARTNPMGTAAAIFNTIAIPTILQTLWNAKNGKEYSDYQLLQRPPSRASSHLYFSIAGAPPEQGLEIPVDQLARPFKVASEIMAGHALGLFDGSHFDAPNADYRQALADSMTRRWSPMGDAMTEALTSVVPAPPAIINAGAAIMGSNQLLRGPFTDPITVSNKHPGASESTSRSIDSHWLGFPVSAKFEATVTSLGGQVAQAIADTLNANYQGNKIGLSTSDKVSDFADRYMLRLQDSSREVSGVWGHAATISPRGDASAKVVQEKREGLDKMTQAIQKLNSLKGAGDHLVGGPKRGFDELNGPGPVQFKDDAMKGIAFQTSKFMSGTFTPYYGARIADLYAQRNSVYSNERYPPKMKRELLNANAKDIVVTTRASLTAINQLEAYLSKQTGYKIDMSKIDLDKPITQFEKLQ